MATQLKQTDFAPQAAPRPSIRVVFSAGRAALAMREKLAETPGADQTFDELALQAMTRDVLKMARDHLSPEMHDAFLRWGEQSIRFNTKIETDDEMDAQSLRHDEALYALNQTKAQTTGDICLKSYVAAVEAQDRGGVFGPINIDHREGWASGGPKLASGFIADVLSMLPFVLRLNEVATKAWELTGPRNAWTWEVGLPLADLFAEAAKPVIAAMHEWDKAYASYQSAAAAFRNCPEEPYAEFDRVVTASADATLRVMVTPAPTLAEFRTKIALLAAMRADELGSDGEVVAAIAADARRLLAEAAGITNDVAGTSGCPSYLRSANLIVPFLDRNAVIERLNSDEHTDAENDMLCGRLNALDKQVLGSAAMDAGDVILKLLMLVQIDVEGSEVPSEITIPVVQEAQRFLGLGYIPGEPSPVAPLPIVEQHEAWAKAKADWQAVRQDMTTKGLTDEQFDVLTQREMDAFCQMSELPLRGLHDVSTRLRAMVDMFSDVPPDPLQALLVDMVRLSGTELQGDDSVILDAFADRRRQFIDTRDIVLTAEAENAYFARLDGNDETLANTAASTIAGVLAKLRVAFAQTNGDAWSDQAIGNPTGSEFREGLRLGNLYEQMMWSAIEDLARIGGVSLSEQGK